MKFRVYVAIVLAIPSVTRAAGAELSIVPGSPKSHSVRLRGARPQTRVQVMNEGVPVGSISVGASGEGILPIGLLPAGPYNFRAIEWGTGKLIAGPLPVRLPGQPSSQFERRPVQATGLRPVAIASGDLDGAGFPSLVLAADDGIAVLRNDAGRFGAPVEIAALQGATAVIIQDFDGNGLNDLAVCLSDGRVAILLNRGGGEFSAPQYFSVGQEPSAVISADLNRDGIPDLVTANRGSDDLSVLLGKGDGTFREAVAVRAGRAPVALAVCDFDRDGLVDVAVANYGDDTVSIFAGLGNGQFRRAATIETGKGPASLAVADFDENGKPDIAVLNRVDHTVSVLLSAEGGRFQKGTLLRNISDQATSVITADFDGDGHADLGVQTGDAASVRIGLGNGILSQNDAVASTGVQLAMAVGDWNGDDRPGLATVDSDGKLVVMAGTMAPDGGDLVSFSYPIVGRDLPWGTALHKVTFTMGSLNPGRLSPMSYPFAGNANGSFLVSEYEGTNTRPPGAMNAGAWGSPSPLSPKYAAAIYGEATPAYGLEITFSGGSRIAPYIVRDDGKCLDTTFFCAIHYTPQATQQPWTATLSGNTITFRAVDPSYALSFGDYYSAEVGFLGAPPANFTGSWLTSYLPQACTFVLNPTTDNIGATETRLGYFTVTSSCSYLATSNAPWISPSQSGGTVYYRVQPNTDATVRSGTITVTGSAPTAIFTLVQPGTPCSIQLNQTGAEADAVNASGYVQVTVTPSNCSWSATASDSWINASRAGGAVTYAPANNSLSSVSRSGTITITANDGTSTNNSATAVFSILQKGGLVPCTIALGDTSASFTAAGTNNLLLPVSAPYGCPWTATSSSSWLQLTTVSGSGNGNVGYNVVPNPGSSQRVGFINVGGKSFLVTQAGSAGSISCDVSVVNGAQPVKVEGRNEVIGNLSLSCSNLTGSTVTADVVLALNTNVTNPLDSTGTASTALFNSQGGVLLGYNTIHWPGVVFPTGNSTPTISGVQVDASLLAPGSSITAQVSVNAPVPVIMANASLAVATATTTLVVVRSPVPYSSPSGAGTIQTVAFQQAAPLVSLAGTTFRLVLSNVPQVSSGTTFYAPVFAYDRNSVQLAQLYTNTDCSGGGGNPVSTGITIDGVLYSQLSPPASKVVVLTYKVGSLPAGTNSITIPLFASGPSLATAPPPPGLESSVLAPEATTTIWPSVVINASYGSVSPGGSLACGSSDPAGDNYNLTGSPRYRDLSIPLPFQKLQVTPSTKISPTGAITYFATVTNLGDLQWNGTINSTFLPALGSTSITMTCPNTDPNCFTAAGGVTRWTNRSLQPGATTTVQLTGQTSGAVPNTISSVTGMSSRGEAFFALPTSSGSAGGGCSPTDPRCTKTCNAGDTSCDPTTMPKSAQLFNPGTTASGTSFPIKGWAVSGHQVLSVQITVGNTAAGPAALHTPIDPGTFDPCANPTYMNAYDCLTSSTVVSAGFTYLLDTTKYAPGTYSVKATVADDNDAIDTPPITVTIGVPQVTLRGTVRDATSKALQGVSVGITGLQAQPAITDSNGAYSFSVPSGAGTYTLIPTSAEYNFSPISRPVTNPAADVSGLDFTGTAIVNGGGTPGAIGLFVDSTNLTSSVMFQSVFQNNPAISIGTPTTYYGAMTLVGNVPGSDAAGMALYNAGAGANASVSIDFYNTPSNSGIPQAKIKAVDDGAYADNLTFWTKQTGGPSNNLVERLRITSNGNVGIGTMNPAYPLQMGSGAYVSTGGTWMSASDRNLKENFASVTPGSILQKIDELPILEWNYKSEDPSVRHIGPVAQDFFSIFGVGGSATAISSVDPAGIVLAGIQALDGKSLRRAGELGDLQKQLDAKSAEVRSLQERVAQLESLLERIASGAGSR